MKKVVSLLLVLVLALGLSTTAFAAMKIDKNREDDNNGFELMDIDFGDDAKPGQSAVRVIPAEYFDVGAEFTSGGYATDGEVTYLTGQALTKSDVTKSKLTLRTRIAKGAACIDTIEINYDAPVTAANGTTKKIGAQLNVELADPFKSINTDGVDFEVTVYPVVDGKVWTESYATIEGTLVNEVYDVYSDTDYVDMSQSTIADVQEYAKKVEYDLGEGVSLFGRAIKNAKYWGVADQDATAAEDELMTKYGIDSVYHAPVINLNAICDYVKLNDADPAAYVYDKNFKYLGLAKENLPYADTYYLASKKLDVDADEEPEEEDDDVPVAPPTTGGDSAPAGIFDNPSTGK